MSEFFSSLLSLFNSDVTLYLAILGDVIFSFFNARETKKLKQNTTQDTQKVVTGDINALIEYHEKVAQELKKKVNKE